MGRLAIPALRRHPVPAGRRTRRALLPDAGTLEGRRLPAVGPVVTAAMSQTVTFPDLESNPNLATQGVLYFSPTLGTLTEVDVVTSGSFTSQLSATNLAPTAQTITGTTSADLSIGLPTGPIAVDIPAVSQSLDAPADSGGIPIVQMTPTVTSAATPQTTVLNTPAELAAFTGHFRIPIAISGHATGTTNGQSQVSSSFQTDTSATITVIYHYSPDLSGSSSGSDSDSGSDLGSSGSTPTTTGTGSTGGTTGVASLTSPPATGDQAPLLPPPAASMTTTPTTPTKTHHGHHHGPARIVRHPGAHPLARGQSHLAHHQPTQAVLATHRHRLG